MTTFCGTFGFVYKRVWLYQPSSCFPRCLGTVRCNECLLHPLFSLRLSINATRRWYSCMWPLRSHRQRSDLEEPHMAKPSPCSIIHWLAHFVCRGDVVDVANGIRGRIKTLCAANAAKLTTDIFPLLTFRQRCHFSSFITLLVESSAKQTWKTIALKRNIRHKVWHGGCRVMGTKATGFLSYF